MYFACLNDDGKPFCRIRCLPHTNPNRPAVQFCRLFAILMLLIGVAQLMYLIVCNALYYQPLMFTNAIAIWWMYVQPTTATTSFMITGGMAIKFTKGGKAGVAVATILAASTSLALSLTEVTLLTLIWVPSNPFGREVWRTFFTMPTYYMSNASFSIAVPAGLCSMGILVCVSKVVCDRASKLDKKPILTGTPNDVVGDHI